MFKFPEAQGYAPNYIKGILDEIALEGLDGITPNDLWLRLNHRPYFPIKPKDEAARSFLWDAVKRLKSVSFYELPEPRPPLELFDRFAHIDPELGMIIESESMPQNIYPHCKIEETATGIVGSCSTFYTRTDVSQSIPPLTYEEVCERWGHKLVVVASQSARRRALQNPDVNPNLELTAMQYMVLERVGRSRYHGEITQGRDSLQLVGEDAKSLFYLRKVLHKHRLITKQMFHQKLGIQNSCGLLLHLPRFFVERRPKALTMTEKVVNYLKSKPNYMEEYNILRQTLNLGSALKKLSKTYNFQKFIKSDVVLHRVMYPEAPEAEWRYKGANKERSVRVLYLLDSNLDAKDVWQKYDDIYDDEEDDKCGLLDEGQRLLDRTVMAQAYSFLEQKGPEGLTQVELGSSLGASKLAARMLVRNLTKSNKVTVFMKDEGRQRTAKFALKKFDKCSDMKKQMSEEKDKLLKLVTKGNETKDSPLDQASSSQKMEIEEESTSHEAPKEESLCNISKAVKPKTTKNVEQEITRNETPKKQHPNSYSEVVTIDMEKPVPTKTGPKEKDKELKKGKKRKQSEAKEPEILLPSKKKKELGEEHDKEKPTIGSEVGEGASQERFTKEDIKLEIGLSKPNLKLIGKRSLSELPLSASTSKSGNSSVSFRMLKRTNMIMEAVHKQKVIFDTSKLQKMIYEEEVKEGYDVRMDKKSLLRIINKLAMEGHVKHLQMTLRGYNKVKTLTFICHPSVSTDHSVIQSAVDQAKMKFHILGKEALKKKTKPQPQKPVEEKTTQSLHESVPSIPVGILNRKYNSRMGRLYGFKPKYMRMQVLHKYMFYLIYAYEGDENLDQEQAIAEIENNTKISDEVRAEMSQIYSASMDWKMFLPPLPVHNSYSDGWALMSDMLLRLPLSLFIQVVNVMYELPDIEEYLNHPIKKHFLVKNLPLRFRTTLTYARKYIFTIHEQVVRLCCTGLLQMGPQRLKEKDQVFVYLNRRALLWDTTSSPCGYHQIDKDKVYLIHHYYFHNMADVEQYWYDLWNFCMHTMLGGRMCMSGKLVVLEGLQNKPEMLEALESRTVEEASVKDVGYLPGDHLGAAGFDSAMFAHLKRNWYWNTAKTNLGSQTSPAPAPSTDLLPVTHHPKKEEKKMTTKPPRVISETSSARRKARKESKPEPKESQKQVKKKLIIKKTVRMLKHRKLSARKPYYDQIDREALLKMSKLRVDWSAKEDNLLLLCKVAFVIFQYIGKRYQNLIIVRQILHEQCPEATDKTSRACQRRLNYIMKNSQTQRSVNLCVEEMKQDSVVIKKLKDLADMLGVEGKPKLSADQREERWGESYKELVVVLQERYKRLHSQELSRLSEGFVLPSTTEDLFKNYRILRPQKFKKRGFNTIQNVMDIHAGVINATILSSLNCIGDKTSWSYQLFHIYQQYPDKLLRSVMAKTRADQMVSLRKRYLRTHVRSGDYLPLSSSPYQLSISYINLLLTRYQFELYGDCVEMFKKLESVSDNNGPHEEVVAGKGGIAACIVEFATQDKISFKLDIPDQIIVMDPNVIQKDETYTRIVQRYQDILSKCKDTDQVTITAIFDDSYNTQAQDLLVEEEVSKPAQNTIAKAATRIALYLTREECDRTMEQKEVQHAHDFFVVNASRVFCRFKKLTNEGTEEDDQSFPPLSSEVVNSLLDRIKRLAILPDKPSSNCDIVSEISSKVGVNQGLVEELLELIKSKKEMGVTINEIRQVYGINQKVADILNAFVNDQICLRCGINKTHIVHQQFNRPWIIRSYRLMRSDREKNVDLDHSSFGLIMNIGENAAESLDKQEPVSENPTHQTKIKKSKEKEETKIENTDEKDKMEIEQMEEKESQDSFDVKDVEPTPSSSTATPLPPRQRKAPAHHDSLIPDVFQDPSVKKSSAKFVSIGHRKIKKAPPFDPKTKCNLNVCVRPWIRINGTLNRRVLDKFLSSVLGHIMIVPLCSLKMVQERFTPAFQPHHTRELVEMLSELNCIKILAVKHSHKPSLFSKPTIVSTVPATGLEKEEEILLEPDAMAITRLSSFIGDSSYSWDVFSKEELTKTNL